MLKVIDVKGLQKSYGEIHVLKGVDFQYLGEAEQLAHRIAILHEGKIIVNGTLAELKKQFPPVKIEYIEKQPTLEEIFPAFVGKRKEEQ